MKCVYWKVSVGLRWVLMSWMDSFLNPIVPWSWLWWWRAVLRIIFSVERNVEHIVVIKIVVARVVTKLWRRWWWKVAFNVFTRTWFKVLRQWVVNVRHAATVIRGYNSTGGFDSSRVSSAVVWMWCCKLFEGKVEELSQFRSRKMLFCDRFYTWPYRLRIGNALFLLVFYHVEIANEVQVISILLDVKVSLCFLDGSLYCIFHPKRLLRLMIIKRNGVTLLCQFILRKWRFQILF